MPRNAFLFLALFSYSFLSAEPSFSQDILAEHKVKGLKGLTGVVHVIRPNPVDVVDLKEWEDMLVVGFHRHPPPMN